MHHSDVSKIAPRDTDRCNHFHRARQSSDTYPKSVGMWLRPLKFRLHLHTVDPNINTDDATHVLGHSHEFLPCFRSSKIPTSRVISDRRICCRDATLPWSGWFIPETSVFVNALEPFIKDGSAFKIGTSVVYSSDIQDLPIRRVNLVVW
jgi:hypothetical protein